MGFALIFTKSMNRKITLYIKISIVSLLLVIVYYNTFIWMAERWARSSSYYSHGYFIPLISGYLIWKARQSFYDNTFSFSLLGLVLLVTGALLQIASAFMRIHFTSGLSFVVILTGITFFIFGNKLGIKLLFPLLFLLSMVPMPLSAVADLTLNLKLFAARCTMSIIDLLGIPAVQDGSRINFSNSSVLVADACSGLKSLIALISFGALFAYVSGLSSYMKSILFISSMPVAIIANITRILIVSLAANRWGSEFADSIHGVTGILVFVIAFILLFSISSVLSELESLFVNRKEQIV